MTKIREIINFHTAYGSQVRLKAHYYDEYENRSRLTGYMPIRSHRSAFLTLSKAQLPDLSNKDKVFMLTGSYGTGKSHLCLMLANYFSRKSSDPEMEAFYEHWISRDSNTAHQVMNMRGQGRYLVAICEFGEGKTFEEMVLSAINFALENDGADDVLLESSFKGALDQIAIWEERKRIGEPSGFFDDFLRYLGGDDAAIELDRMKQQLAANSSAVIAKFNQAYEQASGQRFTANVNGLNDSIKDLLNNEAFSKRYTGLVILADEFGYALSEGKVRMSVFQSFAEMSKDGINGKPIIFVGTGHRRFESYAANSPSQIDFRVVRDRVTEVSLQSEELEQIIAALISPKAELELWQTISGDWLLAKMANETMKEISRGKKFFDYLSEPEVLEQIVQNIYPMHPVSVYCLTRMSQELGSDARSVFSFFRQQKTDGSYSWFIDEYDIHDGQQNLNIYTPDILVSYFAQEIQSSNTSVRPEIRDYIRNYIYALDVAQKNARRDTIAGEIPELTKKILDLMFVYQVSGVPVTASNLMYGLNIFQRADKTRLEETLKNLRSTKIIFLSPTTNEFEFRRTNMVDYETMITAIRNALGDRVIDAVDEIQNVAKNRWEAYLLAAGHNSFYFGDKRLKRIFATPGQLANMREVGAGELSQWSMLEKSRRGEKNWKDQYDGIMIYVLCESEEDISYAQQVARGNSEDTIVIGIPQTPLPVKPAILDYLAVKEFITSEDYQNMGIQEKALVEELLGNENSNSGYIGAVIKIRDQYLSAENLIWYQKDGKTLIADVHTDHDPADVLMNQLMTKRNRNDHPLLNSSHPSRFNPAKDTALRDAVSAIISYDREIEIDNNEPESQGQIRYLKNALLRSGVLEQTNDFNGTSALYETVDDIERFKQVFPALYDLIVSLRKLDRGDSLEIWSLLSNYKEAPYGIGPYALSLFLAVAIRYMGDELRLKLNPAQIGYSPVQDTDIVMELANGEHPHAIVERRKITEETIRLIDGIYSLFSGNVGNVGSHYSLRESWSALKNWWRNRTPLERTTGLYEEFETAQELAEFLTNNQEKQGVSASLIEKMKEVYGYHGDAELDDAQTTEILDNLKEDKRILESHVVSIKSTIIDKISLLFTPHGDTYQDYAEAIRNWINSLHPDQKERFADWCTKATNALIDSLTRMTDLERTLLEVVPAAPGFELDKVDAWGYDRTDEYIQKFQKAFEAIEEALPKVAFPQWETSGEVMQNTSDSYTVTYHGSASFSVTAAPETKARIAQNQDPRTANQYEAVDSPQIWEHSIDTNSEIFIVGINDEGNFSRVIRIRFSNLDEKYKLIPETQGKLIPEERTYKFKNPTEKQALIVMLTDVAQKIKEDGFMSTEEIKDAFHEAGKSLEE